MTPAVKFEDVYKEYPYYQHITAGIKTFVFQLRKSVALLKQRRFVALRDVSFEVGRGETFGLIGRNGAGKSTVLGLIAGVIRQDRGRVATHGRISSLLELGAGFHPDLSGMENIVLNGILMGNTKKAMLGKIDEIVDFSELGDFIYQPLRTYSSGMQIRLGFSIAVHTNPEILLVDEALVVGDIGFQEKCAQRMLQFKSEGTTIILVSHEMSAISKLCDRAAWLDGGRIMKIGAPRGVIDEYLLHIGQKAPLPKTAFVEEIPAKEPGTEETVDVESHDDEFVEEEGPEEEAVAEEVIVGEEAAEEDGAEEDAQVEETAGTGVDVPAESGDAVCNEGLLWWNIPFVMEYCEEVITGSRDLKFCDYLKRECLKDQMEAGVSICHNLKGIEQNFVNSGICRFFLVFGEEAESQVIEKSAFDFGRNRYGLFIFVDVLHRIPDLERFLACVDAALTENGAIIAIEYIGSSDHRLYGKAREAADIVEGIFFGEETDHMPGPFADGEEGASPRETVISGMKQFFEVLLVRNFGGPLYDHLINRIIRTSDPQEPRVASAIEAVLRMDGLLVSEGIAGYDYAVIAAEKRKKTEREV